MPRNEQHESLPFAIPEDDDAEMQGLIRSWRYRGPAVEWEEIVGHEPQKLRCQEVVEKLRRTPEDLTRLRLHVGAGLVISGPSGVGKSLLAQALATALGRDVVVPPTSELTPETVRRLYAQLGKGASPVVVLIDEAETLIGHIYNPVLDPSAQNALLAALDGISRPHAGPITVAVTTVPIEQLDDAAIRPGRLAPRLVLEPPSPDERRQLLERAIAGIPVRGELDMDRLVDRTADWTGAELASAVEEACSRSLVDHSDALRQDLLLEIIAERYVIVDPHEGDYDISERIAVHEAGHALYAYLVFPGGVQSVSLRRHHGTTTLNESLLHEMVDGSRIRRLAEVALAGQAAEVLAYGNAGRAAGNGSDKYKATELLFEFLRTQHPYDPAALESGESSDRGSERMRSGWHAEVEAIAAESYAEVLRFLTPHRRAFRRFAELLDDAPDQTLSGDDLEAAIEAVIPGVTDLYGERAAARDWERADENRQDPDDGADGGQTIH
jgi:SpoVK/Ycf46/Vps4 family AAA+-type ATPase